MYIMFQQLGKPLESIFKYIVADPGCLSQIRIFPSRLQGQKIPDPHQSI